MAAPAKVNLSLRVLERRDDGYHELDGVMARLRLRDELALEPGDEAGDTIEREPVGDALLDDAHVPLGGDNLIARAGAAYREAAASRGVAVPPLRWRLRKRIPLAAGLAGGSTDAATALRLLAARFPASVDLVALAAALGSDVPFFLLDAPAARARGRGERLDPVPVPPQPLLLAYPNVSVRAGDAYAWWRAEAAARTGESAPWWRGPALVNDLEPGVERHVPEVASLLRTLRAMHDGPVAMSGSGSACVALAPDTAAAEALAERLRERVASSTWLHVCALADGAAGPGRP